MNRHSLPYRLFLVLFIAYFALYGISPVMARIAPSTATLASPETLEASQQTSVFVLDRAICSLAGADSPADQADKTDDYILLKKKRAVLTKTDLINPQAIEKSRTPFLDYLYSSFQSIALIIPERHTPKPADGHKTAHSGLSPPAA